MIYQKDFAALSALLDHLIISHDVVVAIIVVVGSLHPNHPGV